jgi:hypothetical protein
MHSGDIVEITEGPLVGRVAHLAGVVQRRALIVVELESRSIKVELDEDWIVAAVPERKLVRGVGPPEARGWGRA